MEVKLVRHTHSPIDLIASVASISYGKEYSEQPERLVRHLLNLEHMSCFEHVYFTWKIEGISLTCLAQLTRHRMASYNVQSMRYTNVSTGDIIIPDSILNNPELLTRFETHAEDSKKLYNFLLSMGVKKEDARFALLVASATNLYMSCNLRELLHIYKLRCTKQAQWEIRDLADRLVTVVTDELPELSFMF